MAQIAEGKKLEEPAEVSNEEWDGVYFLDQEYSCLYDDKVWECIECYLNLPEASHPDQNSIELCSHLWIAAAGRTIACSRQLG